MLFLHFMMVMRLVPECWRAFLNIPALFPMICNDFSGAAGCVTRAIPFRQIRKDCIEAPRISVQRGFTLIELLVVLVVMGIALGLVVAQLMPDKQASLREEAARLALLLENAGMEARASGRSMAWSGDKNAYRFFSKNEYGDWVRIVDDSPFRPRTMSDGVGVGAITVEDQPLRPGEYVILSAHAFAAPFRIRLSHEYGTASVIGKSTGDVTYQLDQPAGNVQ